MIRHGAKRRHLRVLKGLPRPHTPEPATLPGLTVYMGRTARGVEAGNRLVVAGQVTRGDM